MKQTNGQVMNRTNNKIFKMDKLSNKINFSKMDRAKSERRKERKQRKNQLIFVILHSKSIFNESKLLIKQQQEKQV